MIPRGEALPLFVIQVSVGVGGSFLAAVFASEAFLHGGFFVPFAVGVFLGIGLSVQTFGRVGFTRYCLATLVWLAVLLLVGLP